METTATAAPHVSIGRQMLNKVPEVVLVFWVIKILCTTVGETAADYLNDNLGFGLTNTTYFTGRCLSCSWPRSSGCAATCRSCTGPSWS